MNILIAPDSFKDALTAIEVCKVIERGAIQALPTAQIQLFPLADGGEGTAEVLAWHLSGELVNVKVLDPLMRPVEAHYFSSGNMAFVEMAEASGLQRLGAAERNPLKTSTFGTGELLLHAMEHGAEEVYLALGGSATNDAGMGMAVALGWRFLDRNGKELAPIGKNLCCVEAIVQPPPKSNIRHLKFTTLCDVTAPLYGPSGAAHVFAKQKGADDAVVEQLDEGLRHFAAVVEGQLGRDFSQVPGAGAAGGLGFGALAFLGASVQSGAETILQLTDFESFVSKANLIITGEGRLDGQTGQGKLLSTICRKAKKQNVPVVAICGAIAATEDEIKLLGLTKALQLRRPGEGLVAAISRTEFALEELACNVLKTMQL